MAGFNALLRLRSEAEKKAQKALVQALAALNHAKAQECRIAEKAREARAAVRELERGRFLLSTALAYRRYLNALCNHLEKAREQRREKEKQYLKQRQQYEAARSRREAVSELVRRRAERVLRERRRREEREREEVAHARVTRRT